MVQEMTRMGKKSKLLFTGLFIIVLIFSQVQSVSATSVDLIQLDNVWLQELKSEIRPVTGVSGGIYDDFEWFENGAYVIEGENVFLVVDKQELDFWSGGEWDLPFDENIIVSAPENATYSTFISFYPYSAEFYLEKLENSVFYLDRAYGILKETFGTDPFFYLTTKPDYPDSRIYIQYWLTMRGVAGIAGYPIQIAGPQLHYTKGTEFHEMTHLFTDSWSTRLSEWWAEFGKAYIADRLILENIYAGEFKSGMLQKLEIYESLGAPFENEMIDIGPYDGLVPGMILALVDNFGNEKFKNVRFETYHGSESAREDAIDLMYQLYPVFGENMWALFENWNFPVDEDTDGDGMTNREEIIFGSFPTTSDSDSDGLTDKIENVIGTNPRNADTDNDGLSDGDEVKLYGTNPLLYDTDGDGISDYDEVNPAQNGFRWTTAHLWLVFDGIIIVIVISALALKLREKK